MQAVSFFVVLVTLEFGIHALGAAPSQAQVRPDNRPIIREITNERGFTLDMFDGKLWALASHPLSPASMSQLDHAVHQAPTRGVQFELLTPGDVGATIHVYW